MAEDKENDLPDGLNKKRLVALLKAFGEYPAKYRMFVWRSLLRLPENHAAFSSLTEQGLHPAYVGLPERYPIKSPKLQRGLQRVLSALAHWSAIFGETEYLPLVSFPFVKLFQNNPLVCFEVVATVIVNWCQHWFEYFPNPPLKVLSMAENVLAHHDKELLQHLVDCGVTSQLYVWPLLETLFSEVLTRDEWLRLFDNVFSNHPCFLLLATVAYVSCCRAPLLLCSHKEDFQYFFHHRNNLDLASMVRETYRLMESTPAELHPRGLLAELEPLTQGQYPVFNKYPTFTVEHQAQERQRIRQQELEYLRERQAVQELRGEAVRRQAEEEAWFSQQELLQQAEEQRRRTLEEEEDRLTLQRTRLAAMKRELKVKELHLLDAARTRFLKHQQDQRSQQILRLDQDIQRKMDLRDQEMASAVQDVEVRQLELQAQRRLFEQQLCREQEGVSQEVRQEVDTRTRRAQLEEASQQQQLLDLDNNTDLSLAAQRAQGESLAEAARLGAAWRWQGEVGRRLERAEHQQGGRHQRLAQLHQEVREREEQLLHTMRHMEGKKWEEVMSVQEQLQRDRQTGSTADTQRTPPLCLDRRETQQPRDYLDEQRTVRSPCTRRLLPPPITAAASSSSAPCPAPGPSQTEDAPVCLNNQSISDDSVSFSLDRGREQLDSRERQLMQDILELRLKMAARAKNSLSSASLSSASQ